LNTDDKGNINLTDPIKIHWVNYATNGSSEGLNYVQRRYAYGLDIKLTDAEKKSYVFNFVSYKKKQLYLMKSPTDSRYDVYMEINHKLVVLNSIFIQIEGGSFWVPKIKYIEVKGKDVTKGEEVTERIIP
jgi:phosphatidylinositol phosphate synthase